MLIVTNPILHLVLYLRSIYIIKLSSNVEPWGLHAGDGTPAHPIEYVNNWPNRNKSRMVCKVYDEETLNEAVRAAYEKGQRDALDSINYGYL
jgi:hypothetical protein